jgi:hypothetical protein
LAIDEKRKWRSKSYQMSMEWDKRGCEFLYIVLANKFVTLIALFDLNHLI